MKHPKAGKEFRLRIFLVAGLVAIAWLASIYYFDLHPPVGIYVAIVGFGAVYLTLKPPNSRYRKAWWIMVLLFLTLFEVNNLYRDRAAHDTKEKKNQETQQAAFDATMTKMSGLADLSANALGQLTGGDSYCYFTVSPNMGSGSPVTFPLSVWVRGKYPMRSALYCSPLKLDTSVR